VLRRKRKGRFLFSPGDFIGKPVFNEQTAKLPKNSTLRLSTSFNT
jgi:hypothetical protein